MSTANPPELQELLNEKHQDLKKAESLHPVPAALSTAGGAAGGFIAGITAMVGVLTAQVYDTTKKFIRRHEKAGTVLNSPEAEQRFGEELQREIVNAIEKEQGLARSMLRSPGTYMTAFAIAGGAAGFLWNKSREDAKADAIRKDVNRLERVEASWQERTEEKLAGHGHAVS